MAVLVEVIFILVLILLNGVFALSELAVVSARPARLQERANQGSKGANTAFRLAQTPDRFLSTVQVGITLVGVLAGAFGGATLARLLSEQFEKIALLAPYRDALGLGGIVVMITYLSLVFGELVPKHIALRDPEGIASLVAPPMHLLSRIAFPVVRLLSLSTQAVVRLLGVHGDESPPVTEEEIRIMLREGTRAGIFGTAEQMMVESVLLLDDRPISLLMTPRTDIVWLDQHDTPDIILQRLKSDAHSRLPVCDGDLDNVLGIVHTPDLVSACLSGQDIALTDIMRTPIFVPENVPVSVAVNMLRHSEEHMLFAIGEHGGVEGIITDHDVLEAIVGDIPSPGESDDPDVVVRADGSWLLDGMMTVDELKALLDIDALPDEEQHNYHTLAGLVMALLGHIPQTGETLCWDRYRLEVVDMDGHRIDKILLERRATSPDPSSSDPGSAGDGDCS